MVDLFVALGLVLVIEGLTFAAFPAAAKRAMAHLLETPEASLRVIGLVSAIVGVVVIWVLRS
jgi:uncharacterized protein YjeT (DUF2065 family)